MNTVTSTYTNTSSMHHIMKWKIGYYSIYLFTNTPCIMKPCKCNKIYNTTWSRTSFQMWFFKWIQAKYNSWDLSASIVILKIIIIIHASVISQVDPSSKIWWKFMHMTSEISQILSEIMRLAHVSKLANRVVYIIDIYKYTLRKSCQKSCHARSC